MDKLTTRRVSKSSKRNTENMKRFLSETMGIRHKIINMRDVFQNKSVIQFINEWYYLSSSFKYVNVVVLQQAVYSYQN